MNLHGIAGPVIAAVNPFTPAILKVSAGSTTSPDGSRTPVYKPDKRITAQVQALSWRDIQMIEGLNLQGTRRAIYCRGDIEGLVRVTNRGGDLIVIATRGVNDGTWLVAQVIETWPDWCKVAATLQNG